MTYLIRTGDTLIVNVFKEPSVSGQVIVRPDGRITVPLLNDIPAARLSPAELKQIIEGRIKKYLDDPPVKSSRRHWGFFAASSVGPMGVLKGRGLR